MSEEAMDTANSVSHSQDGEVNVEAIEGSKGEHVAQATERRNQYKTNSAKLTRAKELKDVGNGLFKSGETKNAVKKYHHALMYTKGISSSDLGIPGLPSDLMNEKVTEEEREMGDELTALIHNNIAACLVKTSQWDNAIKHTSHCLKIQPENAKALYRRGLAHYGNNDLLKAEEDLQKAHSLAGNDQSIKQQLALVRSKLKSYDQEQKKMYANMFSK